MDSDPANIPVFQGRGYASYSLPALTSQTIQWTLNIPVTSVYYMALRYHLPIREGENAFTATFMLSRNSLQTSSQVPVSICVIPPCSTLSHTPVSLEQGRWTVGLHFTARSVPTPEFYIVCCFLHTCPLLSYQTSRLTCRLTSMLLLHLCRTLCLPSRSNSLKPPCWAMIHRCLWTLAMHRTMN